MKLEKLVAFIKNKTGIVSLFGLMIFVFVSTPLIACGTDVNAWPYWFHDHFFNTVQMSRNLLQNGVPSLDAATPTNDFSVLHGGMTTLLSLIFSPHSAAFFIAFLLMTACAPVVSMILMNRLVEKLELHAPPTALFFANAFFLAFCLRLASTGTDAAWAVPVVLVSASAYLKMLEKPSFASGLLCGLSVCLCVLTRFDTLGFVASGAFIFYMQFNGKMPVTLKQVFHFLPGLIIGLLPAAGWEFFLYTRFGTPVPMTLTAWMQAQNMAPWKVFSVLMGRPARHFLSSPAGIIFLTFPFIAVIAAAFDSIPKQARIHTPKDTVFYSLIWFPVLQIMFFAFFTHLNLPEYAYYPLAVALPFALLYGTGRIDNRMKSDKDRTEIRKYWTVIGAMLLCLSLFSLLSPRFSILRPYARAVSKLAKDKTGVYAIGTGAGTASYVANIPVVRTDGIGSDKQMAGLISQQASLSEAFKKYGVSYYIMLNPVSSKGCYAAREPVENDKGGDNKGMSDWLCAEPVATERISKRDTAALFVLDRNGKAVDPENQNRADKE